MVLRPPTNEVRSEWCETAGQRGQVRSSDTFLGGLSPKNLSCPDEAPYLGVTWRDLRISDQVSVTLFVTPQSVLFTHCLCILSMHSAM